MEGKIGGEGGGGAYEEGGGMCNLGGRTEQGPLEHGGWRGRLGEGGGCMRKEGVCAVIEGGRTEAGGKGAVQEASWVGAFDRGREIVMKGLEYVMFSGEGGGQ